MYGGIKKIISLRKTSVSRETLQAKFGTVDSTRSTAYLILYYDYIKRISPFEQQSMHRRYINETTGLQFSR